MLLALYAASVCCMFSSMCSGVSILTSKGTDFCRHGHTRKLISWGENNNVMCWMANNTKTVVSAAGNVTYGKIEPKSRKNDTFKAFTAAECVSSELDKTKEVNLDIMKTWVYG